MSARIRKDRNPVVGSDEQQLWQSVRAHLRSLEKLQSTSTSDLASLEKQRARYVKDSYGSRESSISAEEGDKTELVANYRKVEGDLLEEQQEISRALEKLEVLLAVRDDGEADALVKRKKRKLDGASVSPTLQTSSAKDRALSPLSVDGDSSATVADRKRGQSKGQASNAAPAVGNGGGAGGTGARRLTASSAGKESAGSESGAGHAASSGSGKDNYVDPARARREVLAHQLPLQKGRKVAFRQPNKSKVGPGAANVPPSRASGTGGASSQGSGTADSSSTSGTAADEDGETWIMATVIECINNDRNRYVVQDEEDPAMPTYNTTLKAVVPLPESLTTLPREDYRVGTQVLGLYPDTSCFYRAIVRGGGPGLNGKVTAKMMRRSEEVLNTPYHLEFEDDDGAIRDVPANLVVERP